MPRGHCLLQTPHPNVTQPRHCSTPAAISTTGAELTESREERSSFSSVRAVTEQCITV